MNFFGIWRSRDEFQVDFLHRRGMLRSILSSLSSWVSWSMKMSVKMTCGGCGCCGGGCGGCGVGGGGVVNWFYLLKLLAAASFVIFVCEVLIYYAVLLRCSWPELNDALQDAKVKMKVNVKMNVDVTSKPTKAMIVADTHLLGNRRGHWFDKLRREWQMHRAFESVMTIHSPDVVFFLGDVFDEGQWANHLEFRSYVDRFRNVFRVPEKTKTFVVAGNHDIGFHYYTNQRLNDRFSEAFAAPPVNLMVLQGNIFLMINSMAMEGDKCSLCGPAEAKLKEIAKQLQCGRRKFHNCTAIPDAPLNARPILLLHMPLYRKSEAACAQSDSAPRELKTIPNREGWECLSKEATRNILKWLKPRLVLDGHVHHSCQLVHADSVPEWTVASFSWRNKNNPSFLLAIFTPNNFAINKCFMPEETTVISLYVISIIGLVIWIVVTRRRICKPSHYSKVS